MRKLPKYIITCKNCNKEFEVPSYRRYTASYCSQKCTLQSNPPNQKNIKRNFGNKHPMWKGGKCIRKDGYVLIQVQGQRFFEHRYIMENFLNRKIKTNETIHHINHIKSDNRIENLELLSRSEHTHKYHIKGKDF